MKDKVETTGFCDGSSLPALSLGSPVPPTGGLREPPLLSLWSLFSGQPGQWSGHVMKGGSLILVFFHE